MRKGHRAERAAGPHEPPTARRNQVSGPRAGAAQRSAGQTLLERETALPRQEISKTARQLRSAPAAYRREESDRVHNDLLGRMATFRAAHSTLQCCSTGGCWVCVSPACSVAALLHPQLRQGCAQPGTASLLCCLLLSSLLVFPLFSPVFFDSLDFQLPDQSREPGRRWRRDTPEEMLWWARANLPAGRGSQTAAGEFCCSFLPKPHSLLL